ncbi:unnamed protein product [Caenorhabditis bovis]|uniref:BAR domain-containing protein n=1 Tax=Caenorhabditis bovis TaxID=2654633 RepID=A0A8S1FEX5_9PELO|nr:unnamed protein product [Caenorhabditis bovis]
MRYEDVQFHINIKKEEKQQDVFDDDEENPLAKMELKKKKASSVQPSRMMKTMLMPTCEKTAEKPGEQFLFALNENMIPVSCYQFEKPKDSKNAPTPRKLGNKGGVSKYAPPPTPGGDGLATKETTTILQKNQSAKSKKQKSMKKSLKSKADGKANIPAGLLPKEQPNEMRASAERTQDSVDAVDAGGGAETNVSTMQGGGQQIPGVSMYIPAEPPKGAAQKGKKRAAEAHRARQKHIEAQAALALAAEEESSKENSPSKMTVASGVSMAGAPPKIDFTEAIQDSPRFRAAIAQHTTYFNRLENRLNEMLRHVSAMIEQSKNYVNTFYKLTVSVNQLCEESFAGNPLAQSTFSALSEAYAHTVSLSRTYYEHSNVILYTKLSNFIKDEIAKVAEARAHFENMSQSMDEALLKNACGSRQKPADAADGRNALTAVGACFAHTTLDYVAQINIAHAHKDHMILDALWSFIRESSAFFSKGHATFDEWTAADNGGVADTIQTFAAKSKLIERKMQDVHALVPKV